MKKYKCLRRLKQACSTWPNTKFYPAIWNSWLNYRIQMEVHPEPEMSFKKRSISSEVLLTQNLNNNFWEWKGDYYNYIRQIENVPDKTSPLCIMSVLSIGKLYPEWKCFYQAALNLSLVQEIFLLNDQLSGLVCLFMIIGNIY